MKYYVALILFLLPLCVYIVIPMVSSVNDYFTASSQDAEFSKAIFHGMSQGSLTLPLPEKSNDTVGREIKSSEFNASTYEQSRRPPMPKKNRDEVNGTETKNRLPQLVIDRIKTFVFFLGHPQSGHSIVGSLMDGHPHMVISHEANLFIKLSKGSLAPTKSEIFNAVWENTVQTIVDGIRAEHRKGYTLFVDGLYEGKYVEYIDVIGDKKGGTTTQLLSKQPKKWSEVFNILKSLNVTIKVIHVIRNPYDNIASHILLRHYSKENFSIIKQSNETIKFSSPATKFWINDYFYYHQVIANAEKKYKLDMIKIHGRDIISDTKGTLLKLCNSLGVTCSNKYLEICSNKVFKTESRTRYLIQWTNEHLEMIQQNIKRFSCLKGYDFDSM